MLTLFFLYYLQPLSSALPQYLSMRYGGDKPGWDGQGLCPPEEASPCDKAPGGQGGAATDQYRAACTDADVWQPAPVLRRHRQIWQGAAGFADRKAGVVKTTDMSPIFS